jgi:hypothetical protein
MVDPSPTAETLKPVKQSTNYGFLADDSGDEDSKQLQTAQQLF